MIRLFILSTLIFAVVCELTAQKYGSFKDSIDGRVYKTVKIGEQVWMAENLNTDRFRNGDLIPEAKTNEEWKKAGDNKQPAWCYYNNDPANGEKYGRLYNWYAVNDPRGLAPKGWHIPNDNEWTLISDYFGGERIAGINMKSNTDWVARPEWGVSVDTGSGPIYAEPYDGGGTNVGGFSAIPGGFRYPNGTFDLIGRNSFWWSSTETFSQQGLYTAWYRAIDLYYNDLTRRDAAHGNGFSVRCIKD
jgi:uncharacterized protein (TIGR02145 family)